MAKILLVSPRSNGGGYPKQSEMYPNGALLLLGTIVEDQSNKVRILHMGAEGITYPDFQAYVRGFKPDLVGITCVTFQAEEAGHLTKIIKKISKDIKVVIGGPHPSALGSKALDEFPLADAIVIGEGELSFLQIVEGLVEPKGLIINDRLESKSLGMLPVPNLDLIDLRLFTGAYPPGPKPGMFVMGSRGCPFSCTFCSKAVFGKEVRYRNPLHVAYEMHHLVKDWGIKEIFLQDDTFNLNRRWAEELLFQIRQYNLHKRVLFRTPCRVNEGLIDLKLLREMKETNFWLIFYGVESGNQEMLNSMCKGTTLGEIKKAFNLTHKVGIKTEASFIIGLPGETPETINDSIKLWREIKPHWTSFSRAIPFPGTDLERIVKAKGHLTARHISPGKTLVRTNQMTSLQLEEWAVKLEKMVSREKMKALLLHPKELFRLLKDISKSPSMLKIAVRKLK